MQDSACRGTKFLAWLDARQIPPTEGPNRVAAARKARGMTQEHLAHLCDISRRTVAAIEAGGETTTGVALRLATVLHTSLDALFLPYRLEDYVRNGALNEQDYKALTAGLKAGLSLAIGGRVMSGRTVLLNACLYFLEQLNQAEIVAIDDPEELIFTRRKRSLSDLPQQDPCDYTVVIHELRGPEQIIYGFLRMNQILTTFHSNDVSRDRLELLVEERLRQDDRKRHDNNPSKIVPLPKRADSIAREMFPAVAYIALDREKGARITLDIQDGPGWYERAKTP